MSGDGEATGEDLINDLRRWVSAEALKIDNIEKYDLKVYGTEEKGENYGSDIAFVDISAENFNGERREYNLVIKYGQKGNFLRETFPVRDAFEREIDVYTKIIPCYQKFQQDKNLLPFACSAKCYVTKLTDTEEVIVLENLKPLGYSMHNRKMAMDIDHIKLVLEAYAEWHALSFALEDQNCKEFMEVTKNCHKNIVNHFLLSESGEIVDKAQEYLYETLENLEENSLLQRYKDKIGNRRAREVMLELSDKKELQSVVLHADCWNNNFLFKYEDIELTRPRCTKVAMLDFQISFLHSPAFDLCSFIYAVASEEELNQFKDLVNHYYNHLANHLRSLGSNSEKLFSFSDLIIHIQKYSAYAAVFSPLITLFALAEKESAPDLNKKDGMDALKKVVQNDEYKSRVVGVAKHFVEFNF